MQIIPIQSVPFIAAASGPGQEHSQSRGHAPPATIDRHERQHAEALAQSVIYDGISPVQIARSDLLSGHLEIEAAFKGAAEALLMRGI